MTDTLVHTPKHAFPNISAKAYQHPADKAATAALGSIPLMDKFIKAMNEMQYERATVQVLLADAVRLGPNQLPRVWNIWQEVLISLDLPRDIELFITQNPAMNAMAIGANKPMVVLNSGLVSSFGDEQLRAVLAHEAAHILSEHVLYNTALIVLLQSGDKVGLPIFAELPLKAIKTGLMEWSRAAELSCDRAAALVCGDPRAMCHALLTLAGGVPSEELNLDAFIAQAIEYKEWNSQYDRVQRFMSSMYSTHGAPVTRVHELMSWIQEGGWDHLMNGSYPRRDDPVDPVKEASEATNYYAEKFSSIFTETIDSASGHKEKVTGWAEKNPDVRESVTNWIKDRTKPRDTP